MLGFAAYEWLGKILGVGGIDEGVDTPLQLLMQSFLFYSLYCKSTPLL
jgi:hypothetical protein